MAQQIFRRPRRGAGKSGALWRGLILSILTTAALVVIFAVIIGLTDPSDGVIRIVNQVIKIAAIFLGVWAITERGAENSIRRGALLGIVYMGLGVLVYALLTGQKLTLTGYLTDVLMGLAAGGLSGMILGSAR